MRALIFFIGSLLLSFFSASLAGSSVVSDQTPLQCRLCVGQNSSRFLDRSLKDAARSKECVKKSDQQPITLLAVLPQQVGELTAPFICVLQLHSAEFSIPSRILRLKSGLSPPQTMTFVIV